jgi:pimeloyl-ACP methyl ester carboxylesterase
MALTEHFLKLGPVRTRYFEGGTPGKTTVVLIHEGGFGADALNTYGKLVKHLEDDYHLVLPEMLGFGGTDKAVFFGENPYEPRLRHLASFFDAINLQSAHVVGNSFGGGMTLRLTLRPDTAWRMRSATSIAGTGGPFRTPEGIKGAFEYIPSLEAARALDTWVLGNGVQDEQHSRDRFESSMRPGQWESMAAGKLRNPSLPEPTGAVVWDFPDSLSGSKVPTLLIAGTQDRMLEAGWEKKMGSHIANVSYEYMESGHSPNISKPAETAAVLKRFFDRVDTQAS